jgi:hypothetical protein
MTLKNFINNLFNKFHLMLNKEQKKKIKYFLKKIKIIDSGYKLIRIGNKNDGGYLMPDILSQIKFCFSPGVGKITKFEDGLVSYKIKSFLCDGAVNYKGKHNFIKKNLNSFNDEKNFTIKTWVNEKIKDKSNDKLLLQMDIEGSEITVLNNVDSNFLNKFKCMIIEFHHFDKILYPLGLKNYSDVINKILKTHYITHIHPNNYSGCIMIDENEIPITLEVTFINKKVAKYSEKIKYNLPHKLDSDCSESKKHIKCPKIFYN